MLGQITNLISKQTGKSHFCPICNNFIRAFLPFGVHPRDNALCPICGSLERHRFLYYFLKNNSNIFKKSGRLIHFSPEKYLETRFKSNKKIEYVTADLERSDVMCKIDITKIPFEDNYFDNIICVHVLEHVKDDGKAMHELYRVLKPDGSLFVLVPISGNKTDEDFNITTEEARLARYGHKDHVRRYGIDIEIRLKKAGFNVKLVDFVKHLDKKLIKRYSLIPQNKKTDYLFLCTKTK